MNIDYVILSCDKDKDEAINLLQYIYKNKDNKDSIYVLYDDDEASCKWKVKYKEKVVYHKLVYSYSEHRNVLLPYLTNNYSFWLDADEKPAKELMYNIKNILKMQNYPDLINVPRINVVNGLNKQSAMEYGWHVTDNNIIQWNNGDYQTRIMKRNVGLAFRGNLHERIYPQANHNVYILPKEPQNAIIHTKTLDKQLNSNREYLNKYTTNENKGIH